MATFNVGIDKTYKSASDMSWYQYRPVVFDSNGRVTGVSALSASCIGILQNDPSAIDQEAVVRVFGFTKVWACGAASPLTVGGHVKIGGGMAGGVVGTNRVSLSAWTIGVSQEAQASGCGFVEIFFNQFRPGA
jgi:hypothetical protein